MFEVVHNIIYASKTLEFLFRVALILAVIGEWTQTLGTTSSLVYLLQFQVVF